MRIIKLGIDGNELVRIEDLFMDTQLLCMAIQLNESDFWTVFEQTENCWTAKWKVSEALCNEILEYLFPNMSGAMNPNSRIGYKMDGWLPTLKNNLVLLMAMIQNNRQKVHPVKDYRELNQHNTFTANADVCMSDTRYCVMSLGFGHNTTLMIRKAIVEAVLSRRQSEGGNICLYQL